MSADAIGTRSGPAIALPCGAELPQDVDVELLEMAEALALAPGEQSLLEQVLLLVDRGGLELAGGEVLEQLFDCARN